MLFYYSAGAANDNNWLHSWFVTALTSCMDAVDATQDPPAWDVVTADHAVELSNRPVVEREFFAIIDAYRESTPSERVTTRKALAVQNDISQACATGACLRTSDLPEPVGHAAVVFGERLFWLVGQLGVRKAHYKQIWDELADNVCPFCALYDLEHPELPAEDLDHYLSRKIYPFAAGNLNNLAPMCSRCNMDYKKSKDVLSGAGDVQRHYPYDVAAAGTVDLRGSRFFENGDDQPPEWVISLSPQAKADEWDRIFEIRKRYRLNVLDRRYLEWLSHWVEALPEGDFSPAALRDNLQVSAVGWARLGLQEKSFLKAAYLDAVRETLLQDTAESRQLLTVILSLISMRRDPTAA
ncbi:hypothetical protein [Caulobacter sp. CCG-8]|uniref:hypothetical protein n=1 Tax=Caulobacter sp. CCG-8 TaxID=3127958 RepID=UPI00307D01F2